jgi:hypothetical protein
MSIYGWIENCGATSLVHKGITTMWQSCPCPKDEFEEWYNCNYLMGTCELCGPNFLFLCLDEDNLNHDNEYDFFFKNWR